MWLLTPEQATRLTALRRRRDLDRIGEALAGTFPDAHGRLGARWPELVDHGATRAAAYGLAHMLCVARFLATWIACGAEFEKGEAWAAAILGDDRRTQGAKAYQLCVRVLEQLRVSPQPGQPAAPDFAQALRQLDDRLGDAGTLASLLPRERIRLGAACDIDAVELRLVDASWRRHYTAAGGTWHRAACAPEASSATIVHDAASEAAPKLPEQLTLLTRSASAGDTAALRVRIRTEHRCDPRLHPLLQCLEPAGVRTLRGDTAFDNTFSIHAEPAWSATLPHIGEEDSPRLSSLTIASCGLRAHGVPVGELSTLVAAYDSAQHFLAWRREPKAGWQLPAEPPPAASPRCRREVDGVAVDTTAWQHGFESLDDQFQQGMARLVTAWERESGVSDGKLAIDAALLEGTSAITWGWSERPEGIVAPPYVRVESLMDIVACRLSLRFTGMLARSGSRSSLTLTSDGRAALKGHWQRKADVALFAAAAELQVPVRQPFALEVAPIADAGLATLNACGPVKGAITGAVGLEQRPDGPGLRWFVRLKVEPVSVLLRIRDPLLGSETLQAPLLPAQTLVDWNLA